MVAFLIQACVAGMAFGFMAAFNTWTRQMCVKYYATLSQGYNCKINLLHWITVGKAIVHLKKKNRRKFSRKQRCLHCLVKILLFSKLISNELRSVICIRSVYIHVHCKHSPKLWNLWDNQVTSYNMVLLKIITFTFFELPVCHPL